MISMDMKRLSAVSADLALYSYGSIMKIGGLSGQFGAIADGRLLVRCIVAFLLQQQELTNAMTLFDLKNTVEK